MWYGFMFVFLPTLLSTPPPSQRQNTLELQSKHVNWNNQCSKSVGIFRKTSTEVDPKIYLLTKFSHPLWVHIFRIKQCGLIRVSRYWVQSYRTMYFFYYPDLSFLSSAASGGTGCVIIKTTYVHTKLLFGISGIYFYFKG